MIPIKYIIITPVRNEDQFIEDTIQAVIGQTVLPEKWIIINDGSTDRTEEILNQYSKKYDFICSFNRPVRKNRNFASKVHAIQEAYDQIKESKFDVIAMLDADITFKPNYFECILNRLEKDNKLGVVGGAILHNINGNYIRFTYKQDHVGGATQIFRRQCYEEIGGYKPLQWGGIDVVAEVSARMHGWKVMSYSDIFVLHHKKYSSRTDINRFRYNQGKFEYSIGSHPLFVFIKCMKRIGEKPFLLGSIFRMAGYFNSWTGRMKRSVSDDFVGFIQKEQKRRMFRIFYK